MQNIYRAILRGNRVEWTDEEPEALSPERPVHVRVTILDESAAEPDRGARMASALERLAAAGGPSGIEDPLAWEREERRDRTLPDRDR
jgi:hypothetical protein